MLMMQMEADSCEIEEGEGNHICKIESLHLLGSHFATVHVLPPLLLNQPLCSKIYLSILMFPSLFATTIQSKNMMH